MCRVRDIECKFSEVHLQLSEGKQNINNTGGGTPGPISWGFSGLPHLVMLSSFGLENSVGPHSGKNELDAFLPAAGFFDPNKWSTQVKRNNVLGAAPAFKSAQHFVPGSVIFRRSWSGACLGPVAVGFSHRKGSYLCSATAAHVEEERRVYAAFARVRSYLPARATLATAVHSPFSTLGDRRDYKSAEQVFGTLEPQNAYNSAVNIVQGEDLLACYPAHQNE